MINNVIREIDNVSASIKEKNDSQSFNKVALHKFELLYFITMDIARCELTKSNHLSDLTSEAISQLFTFQCFEFYYRDYPEIFVKTSNLFSLLCEYNARLKENDLEGKIGVKPEGWLFYFREILPTLI